MNMTKKGIVSILLVLSGHAAVACTTCNPDLKRAIFDSTFYPNLLIMLSAFIVLAVVVAVLTYLAKQREKKRLVSEAGRLTAVPLISAGTTLGIGLGGFIDGIFFHQILQWHEMLSNKIPPVTLLNKSVNMFWDGIFHAFCLVVVLIGLYLLLSIMFRHDVVVTKRAFTGSLILGWGIFNLVEGIIDHHLLRLHNVKEISDQVMLWNYGFLAFSIILILLGNVLVRKGLPDQLFEGQGKSRL